MDNINKISNSEDDISLQLSGLSLAEKLASTSSIFKKYKDYDTYNKNIKESHEIYNKLCLSKVLTSNDKIKVLISYKKPCMPVGIGSDSAMADAA